MNNEIEQIIRLVDEGKFIPVTDGQIDAIWELGRTDIVTSARMSSDVPWLAFKQFTCTSILVTHSGDVWQEQLPGFKSVCLTPVSLPIREAIDYARAVYHAIRAPKVLYHANLDGKRMMMDVVREVTP